MLKNKKVIGIIATVIAVVIAIGGVSYVFLTRDDGNNSSEKENNTSVQDNTVKPGGEITVEQKTGGNPSTGNNKFDPNFVDSNSDAQNYTADGKVD